VVIKLLQRAAKSFGAAVVCVTHDVRLESYADRIIHIDDGRILDDRKVVAGEQPADLASHHQPAFAGT
jgi:putative ABC transport system ATP-binding protein